MTRSIISSTQLCTERSPTGAGAPMSHRTLSTMLNMPSTTHIIDGNAVPLGDRGVPCDNRRTA